MPDQIEGPPDSAQVSPNVLQFSPDAIQSTSGTPEKTGSIEFLPHPSDDAAPGISAAPQSGLEVQGLSEIMPDSVASEE